MPLTRRVAIQSSGGVFFATMDSTFCGGGTACVDVKKNIQAIQCKYGNPSWFITIAPADLPNVIGHVGNGQRAKSETQRT